MSINRWMHGCLSCVIYTGGSVKLPFVGVVSALIQTHTHTKPTTKDCFSTLWLSQWDFIFMAALKSKKGRHLPSLLLASSLPEQRRWGFRLEWSLCRNRKIWRFQCTLKSDKLANLIFSSHSFTKRKRKKDAKPGTPQVQLICSQI